MAPNAVTKVNPSASLPAYLQTTARPEGMEDLKNILKPSYLKIIQKQADDKLLEVFAPGDLVLKPADALIANKDQKFLFTPLFFYREFLTWTPLESRGKVPAVIDRSIDPRSPLAMKATGGPDRWTETVTYQGQTLKVRHVEHLNFIVALHGVPAATEPVILSFSKGENKNGSKFAALLKSRNANIYDTVFEARVDPEPRKNEKGSWYGLAITNPDEASPWVTEEQHNLFKDLYAGLSERHKRDEIRADHEDEIVAEPALSGEM